MASVHGARGGRADLAHDGISVQMLGTMHAHGEQAQDGGSWAPWNWLSAAGPSSLGCLLA